MLDRWVSNPAWVGRSTILATGLFAWSYCEQLWRMWSTHTAAGQSIPGWIVMFAALLIFLNFYRVCCPKEKLAYWGTVAELVLNATVIASVTYLRWTGH
jgi:hypothetical protein